MKTINKLFTLLFLGIGTIGFSQFGDIQSAIEELAEGESFSMIYNKSGDWGAYEGGTMTFTLSQDSIFINLTNKQNYLGSENTTTSTAYNKLELLETLQENKRTFQKDPDNIVFNNTFNYKISKDGKELSTGSSPMEPSDVVNKLSLNHRIKNIFFKEKNDAFNHGINGKLKKQ